MYFYNIYFIKIKIMKIMKYIKIYNNILNKINNLSF